MSRDQHPAGKGRFADGGRIPRGRVVAHRSAQYGRELDGRIVMDERGALKIRGEDGVWRVSPEPPFDQGDPLSPARGVLYGMALGAVIVGAVVLTLWIVL